MSRAGAIHPVGPVLAFVHLGRFPSERYANIGFSAVTSDTKTEHTLQFTQLNPSLLFVHPGPDALESMKNPTEPVLPTALHSKASAVVCVGRWATGLDV